MVVNLFHSEWNGFLKLEGIVLKRLSSMLLNLWIWRIWNVAVTFEEQRKQTGVSFSREAERFRLEFLKQLKSLQRNQKALSLNVSQQTGSDQTRSPEEPPDWLLWEEDSNIWKQILWSSSGLCCTLTGPGRVIRRSAAWPGRSSDIISDLTVPELRGGRGLCLLTSVIHEGP